MEDSLLIIFIFIFVLILLALMIGLIILILPKHNAQLDQSCTNQTDCALGLVCSPAPRSFTGTVCLKGLHQECVTNSECFTNVCHNNICSLTGNVPLNLTTPSTLMFNQSLSFTQSNFAPRLTPITSLPNLRF